MSTILQLQVKSLLDEALNQPSKLRKGGTQAMYFCKCGHHKRKLEVLLEPPFIYHCWVCNSSGNLYELFKWFNVPRSYRHKLYQLTKGIQTTRWKSSKTLSTDIALPNEFFPLSKVRNTPEYKNALIYLKNRGLLNEDIIRYNIGYCESGNEYAYHIIIPSYNATGNLNFFIGRKYYNIPGTILFKKPEFSMNIIGFEIFVNWNDPIILVESPFNAITIRRNAIPLFGKYPSKKLYEALIVNKVKKVYVCLDSDAKKDAINICQKLLKLGITPYLVNIVDGKDPNEIGFEKSWECIKNSKEIGFEEILDYELEV